MRTRSAAPGGPPVPIFIGPGSGLDPIAGVHPVGELLRMHTTETTNRLVCGLDDSEHAPAVASVAVELAARLGLRLCVVHSANPDHYPLGAQERRLLDRGTQLLDELIPPETPHERVVELGEPANLLRTV